MTDTKLETLIEDYQRRIRSATTIIEDPATSQGQRERVLVKLGEYRAFLRDLESLEASVPTPKGNGMTDTVNKQAKPTRRIDGVIGATVGFDWITLDFEGGYEITLDKLNIINRLASEPTPSTPVQGYREALEWYADAATYTETLEASKSSMFPNIDFYTTVDAPIKLDRGERARQALSQTDTQPLEFYLVRNAQKDILYAGIDWDQVEAFLAQDAHNEYLSYGINSTEDDQPRPSISSTRPTGVKCSRCGADMVVDGQGSSFRHICTEEEETDA